MYILLVKEWFIVDINKNDANKTDNKREFGDSTNFCNSDNSDVLSSSDVLSDLDDLRFFKGLINALILSIPLWIIIVYIFLRMLTVP